MQTSTPQFLTAADASIRKPLAKLEIVWSDPLIDPITSAIGVTENRGSVTSQAADMKNNPSFKYTLLDGTWALNQDYHLAPGTVEEQATFQIGYYGNRISDSTPGSYAFSTPEVLTINMSSRSIQGIYLAGDTLLSEYPTNYTIVIYSGATPLFTITEIANTDVEKFYSGQYNNVTQIVLTINNWSTGSTCCKIVECFTAFVVTYEGDDIISMDLLEEREIRDAALPIGNISSNDLNFTIQNFEYGKGELFETGQKVYIKSDVQDVTTWTVFSIVNNGSGTLFDSYTCPHEVVFGTDTWKFNYLFTIPGSLSTNDTIKLYFLPSGADTGKPGDFYSQEFVIRDIVYEPYNPDNPNSFFRAFLKPNRRITAYLGFCLPSGSCEYLPIGTFWNNDWVIDDDKLSLATDCRDRLGLLDDSVYDTSPLFIGQTVYYIIDTILTAARANIPMYDLQWEIDTDLYGITIPYAFFEKESYFKVLRKITEAIVGQCYMSKDDKVIVEGYNKNLLISAPTSTFDTDNYYNIAQSFSYREILNKVKVNVYQYTLESIAVVYTTEAIDIGPSETLDPITFNLNSPINPTGAYAAVASTTGGITISIDAEEYYSWGAIITLSETSGNAGTVTLDIYAQELTQGDIVTSTVQDDDSIKEFSERTYEFPDNELIQNETYALKIGNALLDTYKEPRSDITVTYPGNPAIELADTMRVNVFKRDSDSVFRDFIIYKSELKFDGTLTGLLYGKYQVYTGELGDELQESDNAQVANYYQETDGATTEWQDTDP